MAVRRVQHLAEVVQTEVHNFDLGRLYLVHEVCMQAHNLARGTQEEAVRRLPLGTPDHDRMEPVWFGTGRRGARVEGNVGQKQSVGFLVRATCDMPMEEGPFACVVWRGNIPR